MSDIDVNIKGYTTIDEIVNEFKINIGDFDAYDNRTYYAWAIQVLTDINIQDLRDISVARLTITDINTATLPDDFVSEIKVGLNINERIYVIPKNDNIVMPRGLDCGEQTRNTDTSNANIINPSYQFHPHWDNGSYVGTLYGILGGFSDVFYKMDTKYHRIILEGSVSSATELILEYVGTGLSYTTKTTIPIYVKKAVTTYMEYMKAKRDNESESKIMRLGATYSHEREE